MELLNMNRILLLIIVSISTSSLILTFHGAAAINPQPSAAPRHLQIPPLNAAIKKICDATENPKVCAYSIVPYLNGQTDPASVLLMQINAGICTTERAILKAKNALNGGPSSSATATTGGYLADSFKVCLDSYDSVMVSWKSALDSVKARKGYDAANDLTAVSSMIMSCEDAFTNDDPTATSNSPLTKIDRRIMKMNSNALNIRLMAFPDN